MATLHLSTIGSVGYPDNEGGHTSSGTRHADKNDRLCAFARVTPDTYMLATVNHQRTVCFIHILGDICTDETLDGGVEAAHTSHEPPRPCPRSRTPFAIVLHPSEEGRITTMELVLHHRPQPKRERVSPARLPPLRKASLAAPAHSTAATEKGSSLRRRVSSAAAAEATGRTHRDARSPVSTGPECIAARPCVSASHDKEKDHANVCLHSTLDGASAFASDSVYSAAAAGTMEKRGHASGDVNVFLFLGTSNGTVRICDAMRGTTLLAAQFQNRQAHPHERRRRMRPMRD